MAVELLDRKGSLCNACRRGPSQAGYILNRAHRWSYEILTVGLEQTACALVCTQG
jgi:hypothetical protein